MPSRGSARSSRLSAPGRPRRGPLIITPWFEPYSLRAAVGRGSTDSGAGPLCVRTRSEYPVLGHGAGRSTPLAVRPGPDSTDRCAFRRSPPPANARRHHSSGSRPTAWLLHSSNAGVRNRAPGLHMESTAGRGVPAGTSGRLLLVQASSERPVQARPRDCCLRQQQQPRPSRLSSS
jgi:hypothetical protein